MAEIADIFRRYAQDYRERFGSSMLPSHRRASADICACRTEALGGHLAQCDHCAHLRYSYHSCKNRSCPKCHKNDTERWFEKRREELLPVAYFHLVFTVPKELHHLVRTHQKTLYNVLMKAAAFSLMHLAADPRYVGGKIAILSVLHTWTRAMIYHPHIHCLVPAGGLTLDDNLWLPARKNYLVPVRALSVLFRAKFMHMAQKALPNETFPESAWKTKWVVYCKPTAQGTDKVLTYLARYIHRIAITNNRIISIHENTITFRYKDSQNHCWKTMTLPPLEFLRRFLQHVLPKGFHKVRYYGLLAPNNRYHFKQIRQTLLTEHTQPQGGKTKKDGSHDILAAQRPTSNKLCPLCSTGYLVVISLLQPRWRAPP
jgi:hypothetical protein